MYRVEYRGADRRPRVIAKGAITAQEFQQLAREIGSPARRARKAVPIAARQALGGERIETRWNGKETEARAAAGDWIVTTLAADGAPLRDSDGALNMYVIKPKTFADLYRAEEDAPPTEHGALFLSRVTVEALHVGGGFEIVAPWGETQQADDGWLLLNGSEVYGNHRDTFAAT